MTQIDSSRQNLLVAQAQIGKTLERWINEFEAFCIRVLTINLNDARYGYKLKKYCSNEGNIYTESLGDIAYRNNPKFKRFIADNNLEFKAYTKFGKNEIAEKTAVIV